MKKKVVFFALLISFLFNFSSFADSSTDHTPEPYGENEFPSWMKDLRRAEIITLGAMPFITFNVTLGYWAINGFDSVHNPFEGTNDTSVTKYTNNQTVGILLTSLGICAGIGISDFLVHLLKTQDKRDRSSRKTGNINIDSVRDDPEAVPIPIPENSSISDEETASASGSDLIASENNIFQGEN